MTTMTKVITVDPHHTGESCIHELNGIQNDNAEELIDLFLSDGYQIVDPQDYHKDYLVSKHCRWAIIFNKEVKETDAEDNETFINRIYDHLNQMTIRTLPYKIGDLVSIQYSQFNGYVDQVYSDGTLDVSFDVYDNCRITSHYQIGKVDLLADSENPLYYQLLKEINMSEIYDVGDYVVELNDDHSNKIYRVKDIVDDDLYLVESVSDTGEMQLLSSQQMVKYPQPYVSGIPD